MLLSAALRAVRTGRLQLGPEASSKLAKRMEEARRNALEERLADGRIDGELGAILAFESKASSESIDDRLWGRRRILRAHVEKARRRLERRRHRAASSWLAEAMTRDAWRLFEVMLEKDGE